MGLFGGLALFLLGMGYLSDGLKNAAGDQMRLVLERFTKNRVMAAITGAGVTAVVQSSSVTTVLVVGFVSAGVMTLSQSVGVIMGANIGSTMTAQIVAFSVEYYAPAMIALGFLLNIAAARDRTRHFGSILLGLGLVFFGMGMMSGAMTPLRSYQPFIDLMQKLADQPLLAILVAGLFTALVQSSSATTGIIVVMAGQGLVSLDAGIAMALGANIGTCVTAVLSALGKPVEARRAAAVHVMFNVAGVLIWLPFIPLLAQMTTHVSPDFPDLQGIARTAAETPRQIANANTLFNVINTCVFLFFTGLIARLAAWVVPQKPVTPEDVIVPEYLNDGTLGTPSIALHAARQETARLGSFAVAMLDDIERCFEAGDAAAPGRARARARDAAALFLLIVGFTSRLGQTEMRDIDHVRAQGIAIAASELNLLCDLMQERLVPIAERRNPDELEPHLAELYGLVREAVAGVTDAIGDRDSELALRIVEAKQDAERLLDTLAAPGRPVAADPEHARQELETAQVLRLLLVIARRAARTLLLDEAGRVP